VCVGRSNLVRLLRTRAAKQSERPRETTNDSMRNRPEALAYKYSYLSYLCLSGYDKILFGRRKQPDGP
jgi:hypothetical protein